MAKALPDGSSLPQQDNSSTIPQKTLQEWRVQGVDVATKLPKFNIGWPDGPDYNTQEPKKAKLLVPDTTGHP